MNSAALWARGELHALGQSDEGSSLRRHRHWYLPEASTARATSGRIAHDIFRVRRSQPWRVIDAAWPGSSTTGALIADGLPPRLA